MHVAAMFTGYAALRHCHCQVYHRDRQKRNRTHRLEQSPRDIYTSDRIKKHAQLKAVSYTVDKIQYQPTKFDKKFNKTLSCIQLAKSLTVFS